jgi:transcriptional regulator with XRE-family HTH domain
MSLGDYVRYLRAVKGGPDFFAIQEVTGVSTGTLREIEQRYRRVGENDEDLLKLAGYFGVPVEELTWRREKWRKLLSEALDTAQAHKWAIRLMLRDGPTFEGSVLWWDLGATEMELSSGQGRVVVQRHAVDDWEFVDPQS